MGITVVKAAAGSVIRHIFLNQYQCQGNGTRGVNMLHIQGEDPGGGYFAFVCDWKYTLHP